MSSRYPPSHDSRYPPRTRSRSPPRYQEWRPSGQSNPGFNRGADFSNRGPEPPRAPKVFTDSARGPAPGPGPAAPLGPRGRGGPPRPEFRELRDAPPLGTDRSFRDRDFDRRVRPLSPRPRSPPRNFRDGPPPRDLDIGRPIRDSRDSIVSAGSTYPDPPSFSQPGLSRGGFAGRGRARGRGDGDFRDRGRRGPLDDRTTFRPRDRSPLPRWGSVSRPEREEWRPERRDDDRWLDREERDRDSDRFRRDSVPANRFESRPGNEGPTRTPTPHQAPQPSIPPPAPMDQPKDDVASRRTSSSTLAPTAKEPRREPLPPQADLMAGRAEASTAKYGSRTSSPPPSGPQVPAFGSFSTKSSAYNGPSSNVWKAPSDVRPPMPPVKAANVPAAPSAPKPVPTAPKAQLTGPPPAAPRAPRALEGASSHFNENSLERLPTAPKSWSTQSSQGSVPTAPLALRHEDRTSGYSSQVGREARTLSAPFQTNAPSLPSVPVSPRMSVSSAKASDSGPSPSGVAQSHSTGPESGTKDTRYTRADFAISRSGTPPFSAPIGPRRTSSISTSPVVNNQNIPTAPKAIRDAPSAPRAVADRSIPPVNRPSERMPNAHSTQSRAPPNAPRAPAWNQWIRPGAPAYRETTVPAKRDANGDEKSMPQSSLAHTRSRRSSEPPGPKLEADQETLSPNSGVPGPHRAVAEQHQNSDLLDPREMVTRAGPDDASSDHQQPAQASILSLEDSFDDSSDDGMDLDEEDFAQSKAKFERQKAHLESQLISLDDRKYRALTPLDHIARLHSLTERDVALVAPNIFAQQELAEDTGASDYHQEDDMDEDDQQELLTPKKEDFEDAPSAQAVLDSIMPVPLPIRDIHLPYLTRGLLTPLSERSTLQETVARQTLSRSAIVAHLERKFQRDQATEQDLRAEYLEKYRQWQLEVDSINVEKEDIDQQISSDPMPEAEANPATSEPSAADSSRSRLHKFSSEYDIQKVLKESEETARIEQERLDRESKKIQADLEKEAVIPELFDESMRQRRHFINNNRLRGALHLTEIYGYEPPCDTFTEDEHKTFLDLFKDRPKKWGEIAAQLPGRTYADCIHHYYAYKWDGRFREQRRRKAGAKPGRAKGGKGAPRTRGSALMADLSRTDEDASNPPAFTETGRPRRAATRTTYGEKETEVKGAQGKKSITAAPDLGAEKPAKRRKAASNGEKGAKRGRQPLAAAPVASPAPYEKENHPTKEDLARAQILDEASLLTGLSAGRRGAQTDPTTIFAQENLSPSIGELAERSRQAGQSSNQRSNPSSYWSVPEQTDFIKFIGHFGTDFAGIAAHMGTKTQTMVKNHYLRLVEGGNKPELVEAAHLANTRREKGENMGLPPTPTPITKRRYDNPQIIQRSAASQSEFMDVDDPVAGSQAAIVPTHASSSQFSQTPRFLTHGQQTSTPQPRVLSNPSQASGSPVQSKLTHPGQPRSNPPPGPKMGFFSEPSLERRPTIPSLPASRTAQQGLNMHSQHQRQQQQEPAPQGRLPQEGSVPSPEFMENLEREKARAMSLQAQAFQDRVPQDRVSQPSPHASIYSPLGLPNPRSAQPVVQERRADLDDRPSTPGLPAPVISRQGQNMFRSVLGSPAPPAPSSLTLNPSFRPGAMPSPPKRDEHRPGSVPVPSPASNIRSLAPPPAEPRKTSNVMSLLNDEPEEPRPAKHRLNEQSSSSLYNRAQSPAPQGFNNSAVQPEYAPRREVFSQTPAPRMEFERPHYAQPVPHAPISSSQHERVSGGNMISGGSRQDWGTRPPVSQPPLSSSPQPPTALTSEVRPFFSHHRTSVLSGLNTQSRHNPSPPPNNNHYLHHSRTSSLSQASPASGQTHALQQVHQSQTQGSQHGATSQSSTYAPSSGASSLQHIQAQQQNQLRHAHNSSIGPGMQRRQVEEDYLAQRERDFRREDQIRQERMDNERQHMDRQILDRQAREQDAQQLHAQQREREQNFYGHQYRQAAALAQQVQASSYSSQVMGPTLREQSARDASASFRDAMNREDQIRLRAQPDAREYEAVVEQRRRLEQEERYQQEERYRHEQMREGGYSGGRLSGGYPGRR